VFCEICQKNPADIGVVTDGIYLHVCSSCRPLPGVSSGHAKWARTIDMEDHEADIQQPRNKDGSVNTRFAKLYPDKARVIFSEKEIRDANRN